MAILVEQYQLGPVRTNCYIVYNDDTKEAVVVDPADNGMYIKNMLEKQNLNIQAILLTHGHFDHIMAVEFLKNTYQVPILVHEEEKQILEDASKNLSGTMGGNAYIVKADRFLKDGEQLELLGTKIKVLHTPGHTAGGACYLFEEENMLFSGDTLFAGSVGRTDFPTGSMSTLVRSIKDKLMVLADDMAVYPGHESETTIGNERKFNPFIR
ncbi:MBL fold metallo-hydrolase [Konateibacter massiliensis]|uniref:MBL fold metallo-hydrolase n=1 Tax=Konateibacter massiliensis TaxID=2002841 RepID=UPI0015D49B21|nr:MBL fold metallo-hydrolase [Konateibacter massiliensis]